MSWKLSGIVKGLSHTPSGRKLTANEKLFLLILADYSSEATGTSWPSVGRLAEECLCSERTLQRMTARMVSAGFLAVERRQGLPNIYTLILEHSHNLFIPPSDAGEGDKIAPVTPLSHHTTDTRVSPKPSSSRNEEPPLPPLQGGEEKFFSWAGETIAVKMGNRQRLFTKSEWDSKVGLAACYLVRQLQERGYPARIVEAA